MLKDLRIKFVALNMVLAALILVVAFSTVCYLDYRTRVDNVYSSLDDALHYATASLYDSHSSNVITGPVPLTFNLSTVQLAQIGTLEPIEDSSEAAEGSWEDAEAPADEEGNGDGADAHADANAVASSDDNAASTSDATPEATSNQPEIGGTNAHNGLVLPMAVYVVSADGKVSVLSQLTSASIAEDVRAQAITEATKSTDDNGFLRDAGLYFSKRTACGSLCIDFADAGTVLPWQSLAWMLVGIGVCTLGAFFAISIFFSRWAFKPVEASWKAQQQFTADASHELKTPLTVILANMQILQSHPEDTIASQSQWIESTQTEGEHMRQMINDMLDLAKPEAMRTPKVLSDIDLTGLLEGDALQFESVAFERGIDLHMDIQQGVHLKGDVMRLHRLTSTLIDNACKYADEGGRVDVRLSSDSREMRLTVHNTGAIIAPEDLPHVFDRFYRADKARTRESGSYGLGLAIARDVAREHGGDIVATSAEGEGTTFTVTLPRKTG